MFRQLQLKMTAYYTMILIAILLATNLSIYFLMVTYNNYQLTKETEAMINGISDSEWTQENPAVHDEQEEDGDEEYDEKNNEVRLPYVNEILIPGQLNNFSFYFIYTKEDMLIKWKVSDQHLYEPILDELKNNNIGTTPLVISFNDSGLQYYLTMKLPVVINDMTFGYYYVGRDVTIAYETLKNLKQILIFSVMAGILLSLLLGYLIAGRTIKPIKQAYEVKQRFLADASHELRTPISIVLLSAELLLKDDYTSDALQKQTIKGIKEEARKMAGLVENLLMLARTDSKHLIISKTYFNISGLLQKELTSFKYLSEEKNIRIIHEIEDNMEYYGDEKMIESVISILLDNAIKYTSEDGQVTLKASKRKNDIKVTIEDTGSGIAPDELQKIFDRFYRHDVSRSKKTGGHGLGLSIAKEIVEKHNGTIEVSSRLGEGSLFTVRLK
ncbi:MAG: GHKL domain-containing protein [Clostridia bacterium]|nr:GHKL domain-containing protein [Clostridia bacterium]